MFKLRDYIEVARLAHEIVEQEGLSYKDAIEKAKEKLLSGKWKHLWNNVCHICSNRTEKDGYSCQKFS